MIKDQHNCFPVQKIFQRRFQRLSKGNDTISMKVNNKKFLYFTTGSEIGNSSFWEFGINF